MKSLLLKSALIPAALLLAASSAVPARAADTALPMPDETVQRVAAPMPVPRARPVRKRVAFPAQVRRIRVAPVAYRYVRPPERVIVAYWPLVGVGFGY